MSAVRQLQVVYAYPAVYRKPKGRVEYDVRLREVMPFTLREVDPSDAPVVLETPELADEPFYRLHDGDLWHPMAGPGGFLDADAFGAFLLEGASEGGLLARHPASIGRPAGRTAPDRTVGPDRRGRKVDPSGIETPFAHDVETPEGKVVAASGRDVVAALVGRAPEDYAAIDGVVHRRTSGPVVRFVGDAWRLVDSVEAPAGQAAGVAFRGRRVGGVMGGACLPPSVAVAVLGAREGAATDERWRDLVRRFADAPLHPATAAAVVRSLYAQGAQGGKASIGWSMRSDSYDDEAVAWLHFASRDWDAGRLDAAGFVERLVRTPLPRSVRPPTEGYGLPSLGQSAHLTRRVAERIRTALAGMSEDEIFSQGPLLDAPKESWQFGMGESSCLFRARDGSGGRRIPASCASAPALR